MTGRKNRFRNIIPCIAIGLFVGACSEQTSAPEVTSAGDNLGTAEAFIDAFYSFDPEKLKPLIASAPDSAASILYYQGWAEGGNYKIVERGACAAQPDGKINCPITVQDDPVLALKTGFNVTDTFSLTFTDGAISAIDTSSNDQQIYYDARDWVKENMPEVMNGPCKDMYNGGTTPGDCARAMTEGYAAYAATLESGPSASFIPAEFEPPVLVSTDDFKVVPLGPELVQIDYDAYMSSIDHLQKTFTRSTSWPHAGLTFEDAMLDMETEAGRFASRTSFAYAVLTPDGTVERGCIYVKPSSRPGFDAEVSLWVTQAEFDAGFDEALEAWTLNWIEQAWPFDTVAYPGRQIPWEEWDALETI